MSNEAAGIALIGCGGMAAHYRATYAHIPGATLRLVVDTNEALAKQVSQELGATRYSTDWRDALAADIQIADISTPNHLHEEPAVALLESGRHVILQKPMAPTVEACQRIVDATKHSGAIGAVYMSDLEDPLFWDWREAIAAGQLGQVTGIRARYAHRGGLTPPKQQTWRASKEQTGGGAFIQLSLHHINLACWLLQDTVESVMAYSENLACPHIEGDDTTVCLVRFARTGILGVFESSWNADGSGFSIYGTQASAHCHGTEGATTSGLFPRDAIPANMLRGPDGPKNQHRAFVEACLRGTPPEVGLADGLRDVAVVQAAYLSAAEGRRVFV
ncbi:MAG: Gfo/Idh/MocA family oxidoreductase [Armatimonas sp.]